jgi:integrase/recombinase XerC
MRHSSPISRSKNFIPALRASEILADYEQWLMINYGSVGTYRNHAKSFLKRFKEQGSLSSQLDTFSRKKSITGRSILNRFAKFLDEKNIRSVINDLKKDSRESRLPISNIYVKLFLVTNTDRLRTKSTLSTYATILNNYFRFIGELRHFEKITAERFIFTKGRSPFTSALYSTVLKSFAKWALGYVTSSDSELSISERKIKAALAEVSVRSFRDIVNIKTKTQTRKLYYKESLSKQQRDRIVQACSTFKERVIVTLMAYNGLRPVEVERLSVKDLNFKKSTILIWGKGRSSTTKESIVLFKIVKQELKAYLQESKIKKGRLLPGLTYKKLHEIIESLMIKIRLPLKEESFSPHSLRHTAGQLLYDEGVPLEFIQRTLRHTSMQSTLVYARKAIERQYFKQMKHVW